MGTSRAHSCIDEARLSGRNWWGDDVALGGMVEVVDGSAMRFEALEARDDGLKNGVKELGL